MVGSTFFSAVCALTLSPAVCGVILREQAKGKQHNIFKRTFDRGFAFVSTQYGRLVWFLVRPAVIWLSLVGFVAAGIVTVWAVSRVPTGFVPDEDKGLIIMEIRMPDSASQDRT